MCQHRRRSAGGAADVERWSVGSNMLGVSDMRAREQANRAKRFEVSEKTRKVADLEYMIREFEQMAVDLGRQVQAEEERTGVRDPAHYAYSTFAKAASQRRDNLKASVADLLEKLERAMKERDEALAEVSRQEAGDGHEGDMRSRHGERGMNAMAR